MSEQPQIIVEAVSPLSKSLDREMI